MKTELLEWLLFEAEVSDYRISLETGISKGMIGKYRNKKTPYENMSVFRAKLLIEYAKKLKKERAEKDEIN